MNLFPPALASSLLALALSATASASSTSVQHPEAMPSELEGAVDYELRVVSVATSLKCDASHTFSQSLSICDQDGCRSEDITERSVVVFQAIAGGRLAVATSTAFQKAGVIYGDSEVNELKTGDNARFTQTVTGHSGCLKSVVYDVKPLNSR